MSALLFGLLISLAGAEQGVHRIGIFVGSNGAPPGREPLQHAEADAERMRRVFVELGGMAPEDALLLSGASADQILAAIGRVEAKDAMLVFYYSGHADDRALLLGGSELPIAELTRALNRVPSQLSLHLIDACRSGALTRRKGAQLGDRFSLSTAPAGEGRVVITSSAEWEDSQESDRLGGSFFTLHLASGLRGAADADGDAKVTLAEAYRYVYGRTVESTIATAAGPQHPTFAYDLSGRGEVVLTWMSWSGGTLWLSAGDYLVTDEAKGNIVAEVEPRAPARLTLAPGPYLVRKRTHSEIWTGRVTIEAGRTYLADSLLSERAAHAQLVRKGGVRDPVLAHALRFAAGVRGKIAAGVGAVPIFRLSYELALPWLSIEPYFSATTGAPFATARLSYRTSELGAGLALSRVFDFSLITLRAALLVEAVRLQQDEATYSALDRTTWGSAVGIGGGIETPPWLDFVLSLSGEVAFYTYRATDARAMPTGEGEIVTHPTYRFMLGVGYAF